eukprot:860314-Rhodomonas_salina.3
MSYNTLLPPPDAHVMALKRRYNPNAVLAQGFSTKQCSPEAGIQYKRRSTGAGIQYRKGSTEAGLVVPGQSLLPPLSGSLPAGSLIFSWYCHLFPTPRAYRCWY